MNDDGCLIPIVLALLVALGFSLWSCEGRYKDGMCAERWSNKTTPAETLATIRSGCQLPTTEAR